MEIRGGGVPGFRRSNDEGLVIYSQVVIMSDSEGNILAAISGSAALLDVGGFRIGRCFMRTFVINTQSVLQLIHTAATVC